MKMGPFRELVVSCRLGRGFGGPEAGRPNAGFFRLGLPGFLSLGPRWPRSLHFPHSPPPPPSSSLVATAG